MAKKITYGSSGADLSAQTRQAEELGTTYDRLNQKEAEYRDATETTQTTEAGAAKLRGDLTGSTEALSSALRANIGSLDAETAALRLNNAQLERALTLRRTLAGYGGGGGGGVLPPVAYAAGGPESDPYRPSGSSTSTGGFQRQVEQRGSMAPPLVVPGGSPSERAARIAPSLEGDVAAQKEAQTYFDNVAKNESAIRGMGAAQASANAEFQSAAAAYASSSGALSRHGALTTEFIQALARGQVPLREFGSQMVSTIGKFGGWIAAGAAVYGVVKLFGDLAKGATETQAAVEQMGRFIPGLGGPAGGGKAQVPAFEGQLRDISTQFNVPISEVSDSMMVMSRSFRNVTDAANATRAALAIQILDQVPGSQSEQYLIGIANSMGFTGRTGGGNQLVGVVNQLNELQARFGARVAQVLPGVAGAAPAALASGTSLNQLEALTALGVRGGLTGSRVGTALLRSMTGFAFRPGVEATYGRFGITAVPGEYGNLIGQIMDTISERAKAGNPIGRSGLNALASALGGPQLGGRSILPLLIQQSQHPGENLYQQVLTATQHPRSYQEDLNQVLDTVGQRFKAIGITLQNFGSQLAESGALQPLITMLSVFRDLATAVTTTLAPMSRIIGIFNLFPGIIQQLAGAAAIFAATRWVSQSTRFGGVATAAIGRLPGLGGLYSDARGNVEGAVGRYQTYVEPVQQSELDSARVARLRAASRSEQSQAAFNAFAVSSSTARSGALGPEAQVNAETQLTGYREQREMAQRTLNDALEKEGAAEQALAQTQADITVLKNKQLSWADRATYLEQRGAVASEELVSIKNRLVEQAYAQLGAGRSATAAATAAATGALATTALAATATLSASAAGVAGGAGGGDPAALAGFGIAGVAGVAGVRTLTEARAALARRIAASSPLGEGVAFTPEAVRTGLKVPLVNTAPAEDSAVATVAGLRSRVSDRLKGLLGGPALPLAGALVSQSIPGYVGQTAQSGFSDMLLASFIPGAGAGIKLGAFALGAATTQQTNNSTAQNLLSRGFGAATGAFLGSKALPLGAKAIAAGLNALPDALLPFDVAAPEIAVPLQIAATIGGAILGGVLGGNSASPPPPQQSSLGVNANAQAALHAVIYGGAKGKAAFGANISQMLGSAYLDTGATAQRNAQTAQAVVGSLSAQLALFGSGSVEGQAAQSGISQFMQAAAPYARSNPIYTQQLMSTFTQSSNAEVQRRFQFALAQGGPGSGNAAASGAVAQTQATTVQPLQDAISAERQKLAAQQAALAGLQDRAATATTTTSETAGTVFGHAVVSQKGHLEKQIAAQRKWISESQANIQTLTSMTALARENATLQEQQYAAQALQADQQSQQAATQLAVAQAGGNQAQAARLALAGAEKSLQLVRNSSVSGRARADDLAQTQAAVVAAHTQVQQQGLNAVQASSAVAEASTPIGNAAADAQAKAKAAYNAWHYMTENRHAFDPNQIKEAWASVLQARKDATSAVADQATQLNDLHAQIASAQEYGDPLAQAQTALAGSRRDLSLAVTPTQRAQAKANIAANLEAVNSAQQQHYSDLGNLWASQLPGDPVGQAAAMVRAGQLQLANAHGQENITNAQTNLNNLNAAYYDAVTQQTDTLYQTSQVNATGNAVLQAAYARAQAAYDTARARGPGERAKAAQERAQAAQQTHQANQARIQEDTALAVARDVYHPVEAAKREIAGLDRQIANARGRPDEVKQLEAQRAQQEYQLHQARTARITQHGATREARQSGDSVASAGTAVDTAEKVLAAARGTQEQQQAEEQLATAEHALNQARIARVQALAQLQETQDTGNVVAQANDAMAAARREASLAKGRDAHIKARQDEASARQQGIAAAQQRAQEEGALAVAQAGDDPVAAAQAQLAAARKQLELAHGKDQKLAAEAAYIQSQNALVAALNNEYVALGQLAAARDWTDPLKAIQDQINGVIQALAHATTPYQKLQYQTQLAGLRAQYQQTLVSQTESTIQFQLDMHQITAQQAIAQLQSLLASQKMTQQTRQQIEQQIRQLQLGGGTSEFNLAPGSIKLPTLYDVARAMGAGGPAASPFGTGSVTATANSTIQVFVGNDADVAKVAAAIDNATGSQLAGALRAAGLA